MDWKTMLAYISGSVDEELLLRNEYLVAENRVLRNQLQGRLRLTDGERRTLAETGKRLGKRALDEIASIAKPDTILGWHRRLVAKKFDGSTNRQHPGRPRVDADIKELVVRLAQENNSWGYLVVCSVSTIGKPHEYFDRTTMTAPLFSGVNENPDGFHSSNLVRSSTLVRGRPGLRKAVRNRYRVVWNTLADRRLAAHRWSRFTNRSVSV